MCWNECIELIAWTTRSKLETFSRDSNDCGKSQWFMHWSSLCIEMVNVLGEKEVVYALKWLIFLVKKLRETNVCFITVLS